MAGRAYLDPARLDRARLGLRLAAHQAGGTPRTAGRRMACLAFPTGPDFSESDRAALDLYLDPAQRARVFHQAAAALNGAAIAMVITPNARRDMIAAIGADTRDFALRHRGLSDLPLPGLAASDLPALIARCHARIEDAWAHRLPPGLTDATAPPDPRAAACLAAAMEAFT